MRESYMVEPADADYSHYISDTATESTIYGRPSEDSDSRSSFTHQDTNDTGYESSEDGRLSTRSITESIYDVVRENGRLYFNDTYFMPCDDAEQTRLNIVHQLMNLVLENGLHTADLSSIHLDRILDIGCGPGEWAIQMGQRFPTSEITAVDIGPFDICPSSVPSNVHFLIDDAEEEWSYSSPFSYIHMRFMSGAFSDWSFIYQQAYRNLQPGGILEILDWDYNFEHWPGVQSFDYLSILSQAIAAASAASGYPRCVTHLHPPFTSLKSAGFTDISSKTVRLPVGQSSGGSDPKQITIGKMVTIALLEGVEAQSLRLLTKYGGWSVDGAKDLCEKVRGELRGQVERLYAKLYIVVAKKPDDDDEDDEVEEVEEGEERDGKNQRNGKRDGEERVSS